MGGLFGVVSKQDCVFDLFFGTDYHSHLGTRYGGMAVYGEKGFEKAIHNIENSPFRTKFDRDIHELEGHIGIGCISDSEPQPLIVRSHLGTFALTTVGRVNNERELVDKLFKGQMHLAAISHGEINQTELVAALINRQPTLAEGITYAQSVIDGSMTLLVMTDREIYAARDRVGRTPLIVGAKKDAHCVSFENFSFHNLGYTEIKELGPGEIVRLNSEDMETLVPAQAEMKICAFLWVYYGYPTSAYEGVNVEEMRYRNGGLLAERDGEETDIVAGVPDSGTAHAIGYANRSRIPFARPFIKYTPTWPRSFMPTRQDKRALIARMKLIPVDTLIRGKRLLLIDDSIVRGTQLRETTEFLYDCGAKAVFVRTACPPILFGCKYHSFTRSTSDMDLIARQVIEKMEGPAAAEHLDEYADEQTERYQEMVRQIAKEMDFPSLRFQYLRDMLEAIGIPPCKVCTYCWNGKE